MLNSERELEDYIVNHQEEFIEAIKRTFYRLEKKEMKFELNSSHRIHVTNSMK